MFEADPELFRSKWSTQQPMISAIQMGLNNEADFMNLTTYSLQVFKTEIIAPIKATLEYLKDQIFQWMHTNDVTFFKPRNGRKAELNISSSYLQCLMFSRNSNVKLLEVLFGQETSNLHQDIWSLLQVVCKATQSKFTLPLKATPQYSARVGAGTLGDAFETAVYIMDGHEV